MTISTSIFGSTLTTLAAVKAYLGGDAHENLEPVHDDAKDLDAADFNTVVAGLAEVVDRLKRGVAYLTPTAVLTAGHAAAFGELVLIDTVASDRVVTLPATVAADVGKQIMVQLFSAATGHKVSVDPDGTEAINGLGAGTVLDITVSYDGVLLTVVAAGVWSGLRMAA
jgi:hypothetical protein